MKFPRAGIWQCASLALASTLLSMGCRAAPLVPGGLYSVVFDEHGYRVAKVLVVDEHAVHVRVYKQSFASRPAHIDPAALTLGRITDPDGVGMGHLPMAEPEFRAWNPRLIQADTVSEEELEGYRAWQEANGGVFGAPK